MPPNAPEKNQACVSGTGGSRSCKVLHNICAMHVQVVVMTVTLQDSIYVPQVIVENSPPPPI